MTHSRPWCDTKIMHFMVSLHDSSPYPHNPNLQSTHFSWSGLSYSLINAAEVQNLNTRCLFWISLIFFLSSSDITICDAYNQIFRKTHPEYCTSSSFTGLWYLLFLKCRMLYCMLYIKLQSAFIPFTLLSLSCAVFIFHKRQCKYTDVFHCASVPSEPRTPCLISNSQNQWTFSIKLKWTALVFTKQHLSLQTHAHTHTVWPRLCSFTMGTQCERSSGELSETWQRGTKSTVC